MIPIEQEQGKRIELTLTDFSPMLQDMTDTLRTQSNHTIECPLTNCEQNNAKECETATNCNKDSYGQCTYKPHQLALHTCKSEGLPNVVRKLYDYLDYSVAILVQYGKTRTCPLMYEDLDKDKQQLVKQAAIANPHILNADKPINSKLLYHHTLKIPEFIIHECDRLAHEIFAIVVDVLGDGGYQDSYMFDYKHITNSALYSCFQDLPEWNDYIKALHYVSTIVKKEYDMQKDMQKAMKDAALEFGEYCTLFA